MRLLIVVAVFLPTSAYAADRPNVVLVMTDDQGYGDVGVHGNAKIKTPNLDRFAKAGVRFSRFYCSPVCAPTRASLMTGRYYYRTGVVHTSRGGAKMHGDEVTIAEYLAKAGYRCGIFGKWHLGDNYPMRPQDQGFHETLIHKSGGIGQTPDKPNSYFDSNLWKNGKPIKAQGYCTDVFFNAATAFIEQHRDKPFFVYLPTNAPHTPLEVAKKYSEPYRKFGLNETTAKVYGMVRNIDENFGKLLKKLDELKLRRNTVVIFLTDNGPQQRRFTAGLRGRKGTTYEGGIRVPCFMQWPAKWKGGRVIDGIAAHFDLAPTILALCGVTSGPKRKFDGTSLLPLLNRSAKARGSQPAETQRELFFQCHRTLTPALYRNAAVVTQRYKLVLSPGTFSRPPKSTKPVFELYDLQSDLGEKSNLYEKRPQIAKRLLAKYRAWFADVKGSRGFQPGVIHVGTKYENPTHLCRYQDGTYRNGAPDGWDVEIVNGGKCRLTYRRGELKGKGALVVKWQNHTQRIALPADTSSGEVQLATGAGRLRIWFESTKGKPVVIRDNSTAGDVTLLRLQ